MANSLTSDLILDTIQAKTITGLGNRFAPLRAFTRDFGTEVLVQGQNVRVPVATVGATAQTNATNWESGNTNIANINVPVNGYSVSFQLTPRELNNGFKLEQLVEINLQNFANKIMDVALAPLTTSNFSNITVAQASIVADNLKSAWAAVAKSPERNIILDAVAYSKLLPSDKNGFELSRGAYGFDGFYLNTRWDGAGTNIYGGAFGPAALAMAAGVPMIDDEVRRVTNARNITLPDLGLTVVLSEWVSVATRIRWASWDVMFGTAKADATAGTLFKSA